MQDIIEDEIANDFKRPDKIYIQGSVFRANIREEKVRNNIFDHRRQSCSQERSDQGLAGRKV